MPAFALEDDDVFILHGFGERDGEIIFLRINEKNEYKWVKHRGAASEFTQPEAVAMIEDAMKKNIRLFAVRVL